jgi:hypothetical protein
MSRSRLAGFLLLGLLYAGVGLAASFSPDRGSDDPTQGEVVEATPVSGKVTVGGQPLGGATVRFENDKGQAVSVKTGPDGSFTLPAQRLPASEMKITIGTEAPKPPKGKHVSPK